MAVAFGLVWGSYLNVVVYRLPRGLSTAVPGSHCPRCASSIRPWHNVPVLSFLALGARCHDCGGRISWRYPLVEAATGLAFLLAWRRYQVDGTVAVLAACALAFVLLALALIDLDCRGLPDQLTVPTAVLAVALQPLLHWTTVGQALVTAGVAWAAMEGVSRAWRALRHVRGFGAGDSRMLAMLGAAFGAHDLLRILVLALVLALVAAVPGSIAARWAWRGGRGPRNPQRGLPFGTFLAVAGLYVLLAGPQGPPTGL